MKSDIIINQVILVKTPGAPIHPCHIYNFKNRSISSLAIAEIITRIETTELAKLEGAGTN